MKSINAIGCVAVLAVSLFSANAQGAAVREIRDLNTVGDGAITFFPSTELSWLDLTFTLGMSYDEVAADTTLAGQLGPGWRIPNLDEVDTLFTDYGFTPDSGCANGASHCSGSGENRSAANAILADFDGPSAPSITGLFTNPNLAPGQVGRAFADNGGSVDARTDFEVSSTYTSQFDGVFLVRAVPEPSSLVLLTLAAGLVACRRR